MQTNRLRLFIPSPSSRFFPQINQFLQSKRIDINILGRNLFLKTKYLDIFFAKGFDIPNAINLRWGDIGITGLDAVYETPVNTNIKILCNLGIRFSEIVIASTTLQRLEELQKYDTIVTEYQKIIQPYFDKNKMHNLNFVYVRGAAETYGHLQDISAIVTLKTSGQSLIDNKYNILDTIFKTQACLIANQASLQNKVTLIRNFLGEINIEKTNIN